MIELTLILCVLFLSGLNIIQRTEHIKKQNELRSELDEKTCYLMKSEDKLSVMEKDIYYLVSEDPIHAAVSKQVYDKWQSHFGLDGKNEQPKHE